MVGEAHQIMCSDVHTKVRAPYMKMCSDVNGDAHEMYLNVHSILRWGLQTEVGKPHMKMCSDVNKQISPGLGMTLLGMVVGHSCQLLPGLNLVS